MENNYWLIDKRIKWLKLMHDNNLYEKYRKELYNKILKKDLSRINSEQIRIDIVSNCIKDGFFSFTDIPKGVLDEDSFDFLLRFANKIEFFSCFTKEYLQKMQFNEKEKEKILNRIAYLSDEIKETNLYIKDIIEFYLGEMETKKGEYTDSFYKGLDAYPDLYMPYIDLEKIDTNKVTMKDWINIAKRFKFTEYIELMSKDTFIEFLFQKDIFDYTIKDEDFLKYILENKIRVLETSGSYKEIIKIIIKVNHYSSYGGDASHENINIYNIIKPYLTDNILKEIIEENPSYITVMPLEETDEFAEELYFTAFFNLYKLIIQKKYDPALLNMIAARYIQRIKNSKAYKDKEKLPDHVPDTINFFKTLYS